jgi:hypothetical protein
MFGNRNAHTWRFIAFSYICGYLANTDIVNVDILSILRTLSRVHLLSQYPYFATNTAGGVLAKHNIVRACQQMFF